MLHTEGKRKYQYSSEASHSAVMLGMRSHRYGGGGADFTGRPNISLVRCKIGFMFNFLCEILLKKNHKQVCMSGEHLRSRHSSLCTSRHREAQCCDVIWGAPLSSTHPLPRTLPPIFGRERKGIPDDDSKGYTAKGNSLHICFHAADVCVCVCVQGVHSCVHHLLKLMKTLDFPYEAIYKWQCGFKNCRSLHLWRKRRLQITLF